MIVPYSRSLGEAYKPVSNSAQKVLMIIMIKVFVTALSKNKISFCLQITGLTNQNFERQISITTNQTNSVVSTNCTQIPKTKEVTY